MSNPGGGTGNLEQRLERYLAGGMGADERVAFEDELLANEALVDRVYEDASLQAALEAAGRARRERTVAPGRAVPWWRRRPFWWLLPVGAVTITAVIMLAQPPRRPEPPVYRGEEREFVAIEPMGELAGPPSRFVWTAAPGAAFYRFELFDDASSPVFTEETADTIVTVEAGTAQVPARGYWVVTPLNDLRIRAGGPLLTRYRTPE